MNYPEDFINKIILGNCVDIMKYIPDNIIDLTITSPPYDNLRTYENKCDCFEFKPIAEELYRITKIGGVVVWIVNDETKNFCESLTSFKEAIYFVENVGFNLLDTIIYEKIGGPSPYPGLKRYSPWFEYMFVLSKGKPKKFNPIKDKLTKAGENKLNSGTARQRDGSLKKTGSYITNKYTIRHNVWKYDVGKNKDTKDILALKHPARFPEKLAYDHIISWSNPKDIVLDPMCGSGTTCKMALKANRNYIGIEIVQKYYRIAIKRIMEWEKGNEQ